MSRFKGLNLLNSVPEELWTEVHIIVQKAVDKTIPKKKKTRLQSGYLKRLSVQSLSHVLLFATP